jgi:hypothetical protein
VSLWKREYCAAAPAAITGSATDVGQIDTHAQTHVDKWRWNILYNSLLNIQFTKNSKAVAFADDLILAIRKETIRAAENISNIEMSKIAPWSRNNKINFNEDKSRVMIISRRKGKENKEINVYLSNKLLQQVSTLKCLGFVIDDKFKFSKHITYAAKRSSKLCTAYPNKLN